MEVARVGLVGLGYWGQKYLRVLRDNASVQLTFVTDADPARLGHDSRHLGVPTFLSVKEALEQLPCDAVIVVTPPATHREVVETCLEDGVDVLVEKPFALSSADAQSMVDCSQDAGRLLLPAHIYAHNDVVRHLVRKQAEGVLGQLRLVSLSRLGLGPVRSDVNALWDLVPHDLTVLDLLELKAPKQVSCVGRSIVRPGIEDVVLARICYPEDVMAYIQASWLSPVRVRQAIVYGSRRTAVFDDASADSPLRFLSSTAKELAAATPGQTSGDMRSGGVDVPNLRAHEPLKNLLTDFLRLRNQPSQAEEHVGRALRIVRVLELMTKSLNAGGRAERFNHEAG